MPNKTLTNFENVVIEAVQISHRMAADKARLDELKEELRIEGVKRAKKGAENKVEFPSALGIASVVLVKDAMSLVKGANPDLLLENHELDSGVWWHLFTRTTKLAEEFEEKYQSMVRTKGLTAAQSKLVMKLIEIGPREPRVTLPK
jgi:hypothetical protein